jgi:hypothetical protein
MALSASLFAIILPGPSSFVLVLLRAILFAPIGAICALITWRIRGGRDLSSTYRNNLTCLAAVAGALLGAGLDLALVALRPSIGLGVYGADIIMGGLTGGLAGYIGGLKPDMSSRPNNRWRGP